MIWKIKKRNSRKNAGEKAGHFNNAIKHPRHVVMINFKNYGASRIIFLWHHGYLPINVDHKDRDTTNDRIENLRPATRGENQRNRTSSKNSRSKYLGVVCDRNKYWLCRICINGKTKHIGCFKTEEEAALAYNEMAKIHHGEFANLNVISTS